MGDGLKRASDTAARRSKAAGTGNRVDVERLTARSRKKRRSPSDTTVDDAARLRAVIGEVASGLGLSDGPSLQSTEAALAFVVQLRDHAERQEEALHVLGRAYAALTVAAKAVEEHLGETETAAGHSPSQERVDLQRAIEGHPALAVEAPLANEPTVFDALDVLDDAYKRGEHPGGGCVTACVCWLGNMARAGVFGERLQRHAETEGVAIDDDDVARLVVDALDVLADPSTLAEIADATEEDAIANGRGFPPSLDRVGVAVEGLMARGCVKRVDEVEPRYVLVRPEEGG